MIPAGFVTAWSAQAPWPSPAQVEQDLLLSRVLIEIYQDDYLRDELVFRGGTCLHKLHLPMPRRYSEDLDFVRTTSSGIAPLTKAVTALGERLGFEVSTRISQHPKIYLRTNASDGTTLRIKVEINTHERSPARPLISIPHAVDSPWWSGQAEIRTYTAAELVSTKIRALFQRKKGRDLFDLWLALTELNLNPGDILDAYPTYAPPGLTAKRAVADLQAKILDPTFRTDMTPLIDPQVIRLRHRHRRKPRDRPLAQQDLPRMTPQGSAGLAERVLPLITTPAELHRWQVAKAHGSHQDDHAPPSVSIPAHI